MFELDGVGLCGVFLVMVFDVDDDVVKGTEFFVVGWEVEVFDFVVGYKFEEQVGDVEVFVILPSVSSAGPFFKKLKIVIIMLIVVVFKFKLPAIFY